MLTLEVPMKKILAYHPSIEVEHKGRRYKLSAKVPDWMTDHQFLDLVLEHCPDLDCLTEGDPVMIRHLETHELWDLKVEPL